jgi:hypothetical protein
MKTSSIAISIALMASLHTADLALAFPVGQSIVPQFAPTETGVQLAAVVCRGKHCRKVRHHHVGIYRPWRHRSYFGRIIAGVTLGAIIVTAANAAPNPPSSKVCWYWSNTSKTRGYWDYCGK